MRTAPSRRLDQRQVIENKVKPWLSLRSQRKPATGWIKSVRESLGLSARQLAQRLTIDHAGVLRLEQREALGTATLEALDRAARAMGCRLVYAIVPDLPHASLETIVDQHALALARKLAGDVDHTMSLEDQRVSTADAEAQIERLARDLKEAVDPRIWDEP